MGIALNLNWLLINTLSYCWHIEDRQSRAAR